MDNLPIVSVSTPDPILVEGAGNRGTFLFTLSEPAPAGGLTLNLGFYEQDGASGDDSTETENIDSFTENALGLPSSITISEGATEASFTFVSLGDDILEDDERSTITIIPSPSNYIVNPEASEATLIETDVPVVSLSVEAPTIAEDSSIFPEGAGIFPEGAGNAASFVFTLSEPAPAGGLIVNLGTFEQDGAAGDDDTVTENIDSIIDNDRGLPGSIVISEGATEARLTFVSLGDDIVEGPEATTTYLIEGVGYTVNPLASEATLIENDVPIISITVDAPVMTSNVGVFAEGAGNKASFVVNLSEPAPAGGLVLNIASFEEDGAAGDDSIETENIDSFVENALGLPVSITVSEGATEARFTYVSLGDDILEDDERSTITLIPTPEYVVDSKANQATLIETDVPIVSLSIEAPVMQDGVGILPEGAGNKASFVFNLSEPAPAGGLTIAITNFEEDGAAGDDSVETENIDSFTENALGLVSSITISEGATEAVLSFVSLGDDIPEGPETSILSLVEGVGYTVNPAATEATMIETDKPIVTKGNGDDNTIIGGSYSDVIKGLKGDDLLNGKEGNDALVGGMGMDTLTGGAGEDRFVFNSLENAVDTITDFTSSEDKIRIKASGFDGDLVPGVLSESQFVLGTGAMDADDRFIYDQSTGALWFDGDGTGAMEAQMLAMLSNGADLEAGNIRVF